MTFLPQLRDQLVAVPVKRARRRFALPGFLAFAALGPVLAAGALAATGVIPIGSPVPAPGPTPDPNRGGGAPVESTARVLPLRVEDPAGGPPWGLRLVQTSRELTCVQAGRVVDGQLGVLGQDGVAGDDGRFHPLPVTGGGFPTCSAPDGAGHAFLSVSMATAASGPPPEPACSIGAGGGAPTSPCPAADQRRVLFGLLGPEATSISYRDHGKLRKQAIAGPEGAYLIVLASQPKSSGWSFGTMPAVGFTVQRIDYRDAPSCRGRRDRHPAQCPLVGYTAGSKPPAAAIRRKLTVHVTGHRVEVSFRAPVAVRDARSFYTLMVSFAHGQGCRGAGSSIGSDRNLAKGALVRLRASVTDKCHGAVTGTVSYVSSSARNGPMGPPPGAPGTPIVGRFTRNLR